MRSKKHPTMPSAEGAAPAEAPARRRPVHAKLAAGVATGAKASAEAVAGAANEAGGLALDAAYFAGALAHGSLHSAMGTLLLHASSAIEAALGAGKRAATKAAAIAGQNNKPGAEPSAPMKFAKGAVGIGVTVAVEGYPLWSALAAIASSHNPSIVPGDGTSMNTSPLPFNHAVKVGAEIHRARARESFSKLGSWRSARAAAGDAAPEGAAMAEAPPAKPKRRRLGC